MSVRELSAEHNAAWQDPYAPTIPLATPVSATLIRTTFSTTGD